MTGLRVESLGADLDGQPFLRDISFEVRASGLHVVLGPSGGGKTTLLRTLAGLHPARAGRVLLDDEDVTQAAPEDRGIVLVHQESTLFPHLRVEDNVAFGLRVRRTPRPEARARVEEMLRTVGLEGFGPRRVSTLSGGERQRVALARALAVRPRVLLLDEPLSALDRSLRLSLREEARRILRHEGTTSLYVTHDQEEAFALGDALLVMREGRVIDQGPVARVFHDPASPEVAEVLGRRNVLAYERAAPDAIEAALGQIPLAAPEAAADGRVLLREEELDFEPDPAGPARVASVQFLGSRTTYVLEQGTGRLVVERPGGPRVEPGARVRLRWDEVRPRFYGGPRRPNPQP